MLCNTIVQVNGQAVIEIVTIAFLIYDKDDILDSASLCVLMQLNAYPNILSNDLHEYDAYKTPSTSLQFSDVLKFVIC